MRPLMARIRRHQPGWPPWADGLIVGILIIGTLGMYVATLLPDVGVGDIAEFQRAAPMLGLAHPTGYPLYLLLGWLWSHLPIGPSPAWRMNLFSAVAAAGTNGVLYLCGRALGQRRPIALAAALANATALTFWKQATIAEVYALAALLQASLFLALLRWRERRAPFVLVGAICGLALVHHRTAIFLLPGVALFVGLTRRPTWRELIWACLACCIALPIYLYIPLRLPPEQRTWSYVLDYISGRSLASAGFNAERFWHEGLTRLALITWRNILPQLMLIGTPIAILGALRIRRDHASAVLLISVYLLMTGFSAAYYVYDTEVFLLPAHIVAALLFGEGAMDLLSKAPSHLTSWISPLALIVPFSLGLQHGPQVYATNMSTDAFSARAIMAQPIARNALFVVDWWHIYEALHYLQQVEGLRQDIGLQPADNEHQYENTIAQALDQGRPVYLLRPLANLPFGQHLEGQVWRISRQPVDYPLQMRTRIYWAHGVGLMGYTIPDHPYRPGEVVPITLGWQSPQPIERRMVVFIHLVGPDGMIWGQQDYTPPLLLSDGG
ncbi:MAG: DUF2723 domain-containing protein, partial [Oscillochloris sp.]|nr:DUF2723 domain-containing protein [Oscillochloris sp.]